MARVLVLEPGHETRELIERQLSRLGHRLLASDADRDILAEADVVLIEPALGGPPDRGWAERVDAARRCSPRAALIVSSIYPASLSRATIVPAPTAYLLKPFSLAALEGALRRALSVGEAPRQRVLAPSLALAGKT
jgi:CheY-like chemotaxis protein